MAGLSQAVAEWLAQAWRAPMTRHARRLRAVFARSPDRAYSSYLRLLLRPLQLAMQEAGLSVYPRLPGGLAESRQWLAAGQGEHLRWTWTCVVRAADDIALGSLVTALHLDKTRFRLPQAPSMFWLATVGVDAVERELSRMSAGFATAVPLRMREPGRVAR